MDINNLSIVRQGFANTVFTHKVQEVAAEFQEGKAFRVKMANMTLVIFVMISLVLQIANPSNLVFAYIGIILSVVEILFLIFQVFFNFESKAVSHKNSALKYMHIRDNYRNLITDIMNQDISKSEIKTKRNGLQTDYQMISELALSTGRNEYNEAQKRLNKKGIVDREDFTWSDQEIDRFLPEKLRLKK